MIVIAHLFFALFLILNRCYGIKKRCPIHNTPNQTKTQMKLRYTLFLVLAFLSAMPLFAQTISIKESNGYCYSTTAQTLTFSSSSGSPARNTYTGTNSNGGNAMRVIWVAGSSRWEIQQFFGGSYVLDYYSTFASYPNPPDLATGGWVQDPACSLGGNILNQFNGTGTQNSLPVSSIGQTATTLGQTVNLTWETVSETNIDVFVIERQEGNTFKALAEVKATGSSITKQTYRYTLTDQPIGENVYRIVAKGLGGSQETYRPLNVNVELAEAFLLSEAYPNPFNPSTTFTLAVATNQNVQIRVFDLQGREVALLHNGLLHGQTTHTFKVNAQNWTSGKYLVQIQGAQFSATKILTLLK